MPADFSTQVPIRPEEHPQDLNELIVEEDWPEPEQEPVEKKHRTLANLQAKYDETRASYDISFHDDMSIEESMEREEIAKEAAEFCARKYLHQIKVYKEKMERYQQVRKQQNM